MAARQIAITDLESALQNENIELPAGRIESQQREFTLRTDTSLRTEDDFRNLVVGRGTDGYLVRLRRPGQTQTYPDSDHTKYLGTVTYASPILEQSTHSPAAPWKVAVFRFDVYEVK